MVENKKRMKTTITRFVKTCLITFALIVSHALHAALELQVGVDKNPVMENEAFILTISANDSIGTEELDLSPLQRSGLIIGRTNSGSKTQIDNGKITRTTTWNVVMMSNKAGEYTIPSLKLNGTESQPIVIQVVKSSGQTGQQNQPIFLKNSIERSSLYLQQTTKLVTRLYFSSNLNLQSGSLSHPVLDSAVIKQQGQDTETSEIIMGLRYRVIERIYSITPQSSGDFSITSPSFNGEVSTERRRSMFSGFGNSKPITSVGNNIDITVAPIPDNYSGSWLPSDLVQIYDEWQPEQTSYEVGEPITRTFTLTALNVNEEQLPELKGSYPDSFNMYPDQSESHSVIRNNAVVSQRVSSEAIVATQAGTFEIPAVTLYWFNTQTQRKESAVIPAKTITITASNNTQDDNTLVSNLPLQQQLITPNSASCPDTTSAESLTCPELSNEQPINWFITLSGWIAWLLTSIVLLFMLYKRKNNQNQRLTAESTTVTQTFNPKTLKTACLSNNSNEARVELIKWAQQKLAPSIQNLQGILEHQSNDENHAEYNSELASQIQLLNKNKYSQQKTEWHGQALWQAFEQLKQQHKTLKAKKNNDLPPLN